MNSKVALFTLQQIIRDFFNQQNFIDVLTPPMVPNPGMEPHIHPFQVGHAKDKKLSELYLHTSPEFYMKELLSEGLEKIFTMSYCFRDEPNSRTHRPQFVMLEWYRTDVHYDQIMKDCEKLFSFCILELQKRNIKIKESLKNFSPVRKTIQELILEVLNFDILEYLDKDSLYKFLKENHSDIPLPPNDDKMSWDDYYFLLFLNKVEPKLKEYPFILLYEFPHHLKSLSTLKESDQRVCERFEVYSYGIELCNCFNELTDLEVQKKRFEVDGELKNKLYGYNLPEANILFNALERGLPKSSGIALGVERLLMVLTEIEDPFYN